MAEEYDALFKICLFADNDVGKETLVKSNFLKTYFENHMMTIGVEFTTIWVELRGKRIKLHLWIMADEKEWQHIWKQYIKGSLGVILMYDITNAKTLNMVSKWCQIAKDYRKNIPILLVGNKIDLEEQREVSKDQVDKFKESHDISSSMEISLKTGENTEKMIMKLMEMILKDEVDEKHFSLKPIEIKTPFLEIKYPYVKIDAPHMKCFRCFSDSINPIDSYWEGSIRYTLYMCYICKRIFTIHWRFNY